MPRLDRGIQYAAASLFNPDRLGVLDRPVKPGDDTESEAGRVVAPIHISNSRHSIAFSRRGSPEFCFSFALENDEGAGKAGRRRHPRSVRCERCTRGGPQVMPVARPSLREWF